MTDPSVSVFVLTRNRATDLRRCLDSILDQVPDGTEVCVLVNGSEDDTEEVLRRDYPQVVLSVSDDNLGCPAGRNVGLSRMTGEWVLCVDDDGWLPEGSYAAAVQAVAAVGSRASVIGGPVVERPDEHPQGELRRAGLFTGGICVLKRPVFEALGGYHADGLRQGEETELAIRLHEERYEIWHAPALRLVHPVDRSPAKRAEIVRSGTRQAVLTGVKHAPVWALLPYVILKWASFARVALQWKQVPAFLGGTGDAVRLLPAAWNARRPVSVRALLAVAGRLRRED